jgi:hypothetical protein
MGALVDSWADARRRNSLLIAIVVIVVLVWWWLPVLRGDASTTNVGVVGDSFLWNAKRQVDERVREEGYSIVWAPEAASWCDAPAAVEDLVRSNHPATVVLSISNEGTCGADPAALRDQVRTAAGSADVVVVTNPDAPPPELPMPRAIVVDTARLLGSAGAPDQRCLWWDRDVCGPDGTIQVRDGQGVLTEAGQTRVGRLVAAALH